MCNQYTEHFVGEEPPNIPNPNNNDHPIKADHLSQIKYVDLKSNVIDQLFEHAIEREGLNPCCGEESLHFITDSMENNTPKAINVSDVFATDKVSTRV